MLCFPNFSGNAPRFLWKHGFAPDVIWVMIPQVILQQCQVRRVRLEVGHWNHFQISPKMFEKISWIMKIKKSTCIGIKYADYISITSEKCFIHLLHYPVFCRLTDSGSKRSEPHRRPSQLLEVSCHGTSLKMGKAGGASSLRCLWNLIVACMSNLPIICQYRFGVTINWSSMWFWFVWKRRLLVEVVGNLNFHRWLTTNALCEQRIHE